MKEIVFTAKIITNAKKFELLENSENSEIKIKTKSPPLNGRANQEIVQELKKRFKTNVTILAGHKSNKKTIKIG